MSLVVFKSKSTAEVTLLGDVAGRVCTILGKDPRMGAVTDVELDDAIAKLQATGNQDPGFARAVRPLMDMLNIARRDRSDVHWGF